MFQFSDDFDDQELEDFLSVPLDGKLIQNTNISAPSCKNDEEASLDAFDDNDDLILSVVENIVVPVSEETNPANKRIADGRDPETTSVSPVQHSSRKTLSQTTASTSREKKITNFFTNTEPVPSPYSFIKHKLMVTSDSPSTPKAARVEYERKFPGPAGLIAKKSRDILSSGNEVLNGGNSKQQLDMSITDESLFENSSWQQLLDDVNSKSCELLKIIDEFSVAAVKRMNIIKHTSRKIPLFAAVIFHLDTSVPDPSVILKDPSGEIRGTLHKDIWEQYSHLLAVGNALLLRQVSVLSIANSRKLYLNITGNNIDTIYTVRTGKPVLITRVSPAAALDYLSEKTNEANSRKFTNFTSNESSRTYTSSNVHRPSSKQSTEGSRRIEQSENVPPRLAEAQLSTSVLENLPPSSHVTEKKSDVNIECSSGSICNELDGIDADSIFGDF